MPHESTNESTNESNREFGALDAAMQEVHDRDGTTLPHPVQSWVDLQHAGLLCIRTKQDRIDAEALFTAYGYERMEDACRVAKQGHTAPFVSSVASVLEPPRKSRNDLLKLIRQRSRERYNILNTVSNMRMDRMIEYGIGHGKQWIACHQAHGEVTPEWIDASERDKSITYSDTPRSDDDLAAVLEKLGGS